jgi:hypothetical protein
MRFAKKIVIICIIGTLILSALFGVSWSAGIPDSDRGARQQVDITVKHENGTLINASDAIDVAVDTNVIVDFNQLINESTVEDNITLKYQANMTIVAGKFSFETIDDNTTVIFLPDENLTKETTYDFNINAWVRNETEWSIFPTGQTISFTTEDFDNGTISGYILDDTNLTGIAGVNVTAIGNNNETWTYTDANGYYEFSLYPATYKIVADGTEVHYLTSENESVNVTEDVVLVNVNLSLEEMPQNVEVMVRTRESSGMAAPNNWVDADGATDTLLKPDIKIVFNEEMNPDSVKANLTLYTGLNFVNGSLSSDDNKTFYFDPTLDLAVDTDYELVITLGVQPLNTSQDAPLWRDLSFMFTTRGDPISSVFPVDGASDVPVDTVIEITFNIDIDTTLLRNSTKISSVNGEVPYTALYDNVTHTATLTPDQDLEGDTAYTVYIADTLKDTMGIKLFSLDDYPNMYKWSFRIIATKGTLNITVKDKNQAPLPSVEISVYFGAQNFGIFSTDLDGNVAVILLEGEYNFTATLNGYQDITVEGIMIDAGEKNDQPVNMVSETGSISGTIKDTDGNPLGDVIVLAQIDDNMMGTVTTDANGQYTISNLLPGSYNLSFSIEGYDEVTVENVQVQADSLKFENVELTKSAPPPEPDDDDEDEIDWMMVIIIVIIILVIIVLIAALATRKKPEYEEAEAVEEGGYGAAAAPSREYHTAPPSTYRELEARTAPGAQPPKPKYYGRCPVCMHQVIGSDECFHCAIRATYEVQEPPMMYYE